MTKVATKEVEIIACQDRIAYNGNIYMSSVAEIIEEIGQYMDNVTVSFKSIDKNPDIAQPYSVGLEQTSVLVRLKDDVQKYRILDVSTMFEASSSNSSMIGESRRNTCSSPPSTMYAGTSTPTSMCSQTTRRVRPQNF